MLPFLYHKSATTCQNDSNKVSNSKLKSDLCNCVAIEIIEPTASPQQQHKRGTIFGTPYRARSWENAEKEYVLKLESRFQFHFILFVEGRLPFNNS